jgi:hypothetical protein
MGQNQWRQKKKTTTKEWGCVRGLGNITKIEAIFSSLLKYNREGVLEK